MDEAIADLMGDEPNSASAFVDDGENSAATQLLSMPSYVNTDMAKMLPKDILSKQGKRVMDDRGSLCDLLKKHADTVADITDLQSIQRDAEQENNFGAIQHLQSQIDIKNHGLQDIVQ